MMSRYPGRGGRSDSSILTGVHAMSSYGGGGGRSGGGEGTRAFSGVGGMPASNDPYRGQVILDPGSEREGLGASSPYGVRPYEADNASSQATPQSSSWSSASTSPKAPFGARASDRVGIQESPRVTPASASSATVNPGSASSAAGGSSSGATGIGELLKELAKQGPALLRSEVMLAKAEVRENANKMATHAGAMATGGAVAQAGLLLVLAAVAVGISNIIGLGWALLVVGAAALGVGAGMVGAAKAKMSGHSLAPQQTLQSLNQDKDAIKGALHERQ